MCGACGGSLARAPWEATTHGATRRDLLARADEAEQLTGGRLQVRPFGPAGYQTCSRTGRKSIHSSLDGLIHELLSDYRAPVIASAHESVGPVAAAIVRLTAATKHNQRHQKE